MTNVIEFQSAFQKRHAQQKLADRAERVKGRVLQEAQEFCEAQGVKQGSYESALVNQAATRIAEKVAARKPVCAYDDPANEKRGSKYDATRDLDIKEIAKLVRADIKQAIKVGRLPKGTKTSVKIDRFSMGQALDITIKAIPCTIYNPNYVKATANFTDYHCDEASEIRQNEGQFSRDLQSAMKALESIGHAYNRSNNDSMSDYSDNRFYLHVKVDYDLKEAAKEAESPAF